jgi:hypothetical protein
MLPGDQLDRHQSQIFRGQKNPEVLGQLRHKKMHLSLLLIPRCQFAEQISALDSANFFPWQELFFVRAVS